MRRYSKVEGLYSLRRPPYSNLSRALTPKIDSMSSRRSGSFFLSLSELFASIDTKRSRHIHKSIRSILCGPRKEYLFNIFPFLFLRENSTGRFMRGHLQLHNLSGVTHGQEGIRLTLLWMNCPKAESTHRPQKVGMCEQQYS